MNPLPQPPKHSQKFTPQPQIHLPETESPFEDHLPPLLETGDSQALELPGTGLTSERHSTNDHAINQHSHPLPPFFSRLLFPWPDFLPPTLVPGTQMSQDPPSVSYFLSLGKLCLSSLGSL